MSDVAERVKKIVVECLGVEASKVTDTPISAMSWRQVVSTRSNSYWPSRRSSAVRFPMMPRRDF